MRAKIALLLAGTGLLAVIPVFAHSFAAEYDRNKPIKLTGKVTKFECSISHSNSARDLMRIARKNSFIVLCKHYHALPGMPALRIRAL